MTTTHKPATPLPWKAARYSLWAAEYLIGKVNGATNEADFGARRNEDDAAYIAHAANAYPKLVEALRVALANIETAKPQIRNFPELWEDLNSANALLRELGETE